MSQTVSRAVDILRFLRESPRTLTEVTGHIGMHKSTALRFLQTLEAEGFVRHLDNGAYALGLSLIELGESALNQVDARQVARPHLAWLASHVDLTVQFAQLVGDNVFYIEKIEGNTAISMGSKVGHPAVLQTAATAKAIVAYLPSEQMNRIVETISFQQFTPTTLANKEQYLRELARIRARGWAEDNGEKEDYINSLSIPVRDTSGQVHLSIAMTALKVTFPMDTLRAHIPLLTEAARRISADLSYPGSSTP